MAEVRYVWVRVGNGQPEPAVLEGEKPNRKVTTMGCPDPFMFDEEGCPAWLCYTGDNYNLAVLKPPR